MYTALTSWPEVSRNAEDIEKLYGKSPLGIDLEFTDDRPTILGLSDGQFHVSVPYAEGRPFLIELLQRHPQTTIVGHNFLAADLPLLQKDGIPLRAEQVEDSIIHWWLLHPHLSKSSNKAALEEDADERRGRGLNNLWTMASYYTDFPHWKDCRGAFCEGPCPEHDPHGYNGLDSAAPVIALPQMKRTAKLRGVEKLYPMHRDLAIYLAEMRDFGVRVDVPYVDQLREEFEQEKKAIAEKLPFNPGSPKQVIAYFKDKGILLDDAQEETIREYIEEEGDETVPDELILLYDYKELGNGVDRWFKPVYRDKNGFLKGYLDDRGYIHPHVAYFTSSARLMSSSPNAQNFGKRRRSRSKCECGHTKVEHISSCAVLNCDCKAFFGVAIGKKARRAIIAPDDWYITRADLSNAEGRTVLYHSGYDSPSVDMHSWMRDSIGLKEDEPFSIALGGAREAAKSVTHASNYMEGLQVKDRSELRSPRIKKEIAEGARVVFWDWTFKGKVVTFTGVNLARRAFGNSSFDNRRRALDVMTRYIDQSFPKIRDFHKRVAAQVEKDSAIRTPHGYVLLTYEPNPNDQLKAAVSVWGQQTTAHLNKLAIIDVMKKFHAGRPMRAVLPVHDELVNYVHSSVSPAEAMSWIKGSMELDLPEMPGFRIPADPTYGPNWADQKKK